LANRKIKGRGLCGYVCHCCHTTRPPRGAGGARTENVVRFSALEKSARRLTTEAAIAKTADAAAGQKKSARRGIPFEIPQRGESAHRLGGVCKHCICCSRRLQSLDGESWFAEELVRRPIGGRFVGEIRRAMCPHQALPGLDDVNGARLPTRMEVEGNIISPFPSTGPLALDRAMIGRGMFHMRSR